MRALVDEVVVQRFRSVDHVAFGLGPLCALVGEADAGKSNLLAALRAALDPRAAPLGPGDLPRGGDGPVLVRLRVRGARVELCGTPPDVTWDAGVRPPPVLFLPAAERCRGVVEPASDRPLVVRRALRLLADAAGEDGSDAAAAQALPAALEGWLAAGVNGLVILIEEPELFLRPQAQRYLYRLLRRLVEAGNQVVYSTHSPAFLNVARLDELLFVRRRAGAGTWAMRARRVEGLDELRAQSEFDAERAELFLSRAALLVEGQTERLSLPFVFSALGIDPDREGISIVECGGKSSMPMFARVCCAAGVPFVALHDRDAPPGRRPSPTHERLNAAIAAIAEPGCTVVLAPDFERVAGLRGHDHKPQQAHRRFASLPADRIPEPLARAALLTAGLSRGNPPLTAAGASAG